MATESDVASVNEASESNRRASSASTGSNGLCGRAVRVGAPIPDGGEADTDDGQRENDTGRDSDDASDRAESEPAAEPTDDDDAPDEEEWPTQHMRAVIVTSGATLLGLLAAIVSGVVATENGDPNNLLGFAILLGAVFIQFPLYNLLGIDSEHLETKDQVYVFAMTFIMWFVVWSVLLTTGALQ